MAYTFIIVKRKKLAHKCYRLLNLNFVLHKIRVCPCGSLWKRTGKLAANTISVKMHPAPLLTVRARDGPNTMRSAE